MDKERVAVARQQTDKQWHEALNRHPDWKSRMMNLLALVGSADVALADEAQSRAGRACSQTSVAEAFKDGKKVQWRSAHGVIEVEES